MESGANKRRNTRHSGKLEKGAKDEQRSIVATEAGEARR